MSRFAAFLWILIACLLGTVVWFTTPRERAVTAESPLLPDFSIASCERLNIAWPDGQTATIERGPWDGTWLLTTAIGDQPAVAWPAETGRMQGLLRLISELRTAPPALSTQAALPMPKAVVVTIDRQKQQPIRLAIDPNTLGGAGRVALIDESSRVRAMASASEGFVRSLDKSAVESWRQADLLPWPPESGVSLRSTSTTGETDLTRSGSSWIMQAPIATKADAGAAQGVLLLLSKTALERFLPASAGMESGFSPPARKIVIGARPSGADRNARIEQRIEVGPALDSQSRIVRVSGANEGNAQPLWGPLYGVVDSSSLAAISEDPASFVSRLSVDLTPADISKLEFGPDRIAIARDRNGNFGAADSTVREFLRLLCETPAASILITPTADTPDNADRTAVRLFGTNDTVLKELQVKATTTASKVAGSPATPALEVTEGRIVRLIPAQRPRDILAALAQPAPQPPK